jgi:hypothetical protein
MAMYLIDQLAATANTVAPPETGVKAIPQSPDAV